MTTKPSNAAWADKPFELISPPHNRLDGSLPHVKCASDMAQAHNMLIRGLNSLVQQGPYIPINNTADVKDFLHYTQCWVKMVNHHHHVEESVIFPELEKFAGKPGLMDDPKHEHELFYEGMQKLLAYAGATAPKEFKWDDMKTIIDSFSKPLMDHLNAEIDSLLGLESLDPEGLREAWKRAESISKRHGSAAMMYDVFPMVLGCVDKTFEGGNDFPRLPWFLPYMVKYWYGWGQGAWRFNPCDWWGRPRPLAFVPALRN